MASPLLDAPIQAIAQIARSDPGGRGLSGVVAEFPLLDAARLLSGGQRILLITGFCIKAARIGESDGPPGTLTLAAALRQLGKEVALLTDAYSAGLLAAAEAAHGLSFPTTVLDTASPDAACLRLAASFAPTHIVSIERPGKAQDGHCYSMRGEILDDIVPTADILFQHPDRSWKTIAIGDGGNELGMGSLRERMKTRVPNGELIFCVTPADMTLAAGISNWGAYALAAALSLLSGRLLLTAPQKEREVLEALLSAGAVDGCTKTPSLSVDGIPWERYAKALEAIYRETQKALSSIGGATR